MKRPATSRFRYRTTAAIPLLIEAANLLPAGHPTRRALVLALSEVHQQRLPEPVQEHIAALVVQAVLLGPPTMSRVSS